MVKNWRAGWVGVVERVMGRGIAVAVRGISNDVVAQRRRLIRGWVVG